MGIGYATGPTRARDAAERALGSPLIDTEIIGARGILLSIAGGDDLSLVEVNDAAEVVRQTATDDTNIIFGAMVDDRLNEDEVWVTVVATGYEPSTTRPVGRWTTVSAQLPFSPAQPNELQGVVRMRSLRGAPRQRR